MHLKIDLVVLEREFCKWKRGEKVINLSRMQCWDFKRLHLSIKSVTNKKFEDFQLEAFFFTIITFNKTGQYICSLICFALIIIYLKIIAKKLLDPPNLIETTVFYVHKMTKFVVIGKHKNFVFAIFQIVPLWFENFDKC